MYSVYIKNNKDGENGFIIPVKDSVALAGSLKKLIDDPSLRLDMGKKARAFAVERFDIEDVVRVHLDVYNSILCN